VRFARKNSPNLKLWVTSLLELNINDGEKSLIMVVPGSRIFRGSCGQCYDTFFVCNLLSLVLSFSVC
jgi:hypothetical protein